MPQGRKGACDGAKASQHFIMCSCCQVSQQIMLYRVWRLPFSLHSIHAHAVHLSLPTGFQLPHVGRTLAAPVMLRRVNT